MTGLLQLVLKIVAPLKLNLALLFGHYGPALAHFGSAVELAPVDARDLNDNALVNHVKRSQWDELLVVVYLGGLELLLNKLLGVENSDIIG